MAAPAGATAGPASTASAGGATASAGQVSELVQFGAPAEPAVPKPATPVRLWNARHGVPIAAVTATEDGSAAVSIDESNHARLWPALDGTREPWVLPLTMPVEAAIVHDGAVFAVAARDDSGGLELAAVSGDGELTAHVKLPPEPGFAAVLAHGSGFVALRRDQALVAFDVRGDVTATLVPPAGEHVMKLVARGGHMLALVRTKEGMRGHWLANESVNAQLAWGEQTPKLTVDLEHAFLSPDGKRLVTHRQPFDADVQTLVVDLVSGRAKPLLNPLSSAGPMGVPIGIAADGRIVTAFNDFELSTFEWWKPSGYSTASLGGSTYVLETVAVDKAVVTDGSIVSFSGHELAIARPNTASGPSDVRFLGYRTTRVGSLRSSPVGAIGSIGRVARLLDDRVRGGQRMPALDAIPFAKDLALIKLTTHDGAEPVVSVSNGIDPAWLESAKPKPSAASVPRIALFDLATKQELQHWPTARAIRYEPATQLMAIDRGTKVMFARFDATARTFTDERTIAATVSDVVLLDPALADGAIALLVRTRGKTIEARALRDLSAPLPAPTTLTGTLEGIDRAGRLYVREDADTIVVHAGTAATRITGLAGWTIRPDPAGTQIVAFARSRLMLLAANGEPAWTVGFPGVTDATWTPDGGLVVLAGDLARVEPATGRVIAAQCGWGFALRSAHPELPDVPSTTETLCDQ